MVIGAERYDVMHILNMIKDVKHKQSFFVIILLYLLLLAVQYLIPMSQRLFPLPALERISPSSTCPILAGDRKWEMWSRMKEGVARLVQIPRMHILYTLQES